MSILSLAMSSRTNPTTNVPQGSGLNLPEPRLRVASGSQEDPVHHRRPDEQAPKEPKVVAPRPECGVPRIPLTTRALAARGDSLEYLRRRVAVSHAEEETWDHFKMCPLFRGLDTLTDWNPTHTIVQHARWPTRSPATQQLATILKQTEVLEAVRRGLVPTAVYTLLRTHPEDHQATAAHMQRTAVAKTAELPHTAPTNTGSMQPPCPKRIKPTFSNSCCTNHENCPTTYHPTRDPHHAYTPSTRHNTGTAHTRTTSTASTPTSMRAPQVPRSPTPPSVQR